MAWKRLLAACVVLGGTVCGVAAASVDVSPLAYQPNGDRSATFQVAISNSESMPVYGIRFPALSFYDRNSGGLLAHGSFDSEWDPLYNRRIAPGQTLFWNFTFPQQAVYGNPSSGYLLANANARWWHSPDVYLDGRMLTFDVPPIIRADEERTYLPVRMIAEALGAEVGWQPATQTVRLTGRGRVVEFRVAQRSYTVDSRKVEMDAAPFVLSNRTLVPVRYVAQPLGLGVEWDSGHGRVLLTQ